MNARRPAAYLWRNTLTRRQCWQLNTHKSRFSWSFLLLGVGVMVRLIPYLYNRALWLDEANLANGIRESSLAELTGVLPYNQAAPIGFLWLEKLTILLLGDSEYALRLVPLLASIAALFLFYRVVQTIFQGPFDLLALAFFAFSPPLVYYASEVKQYGLDVTCALWILLSTLTLLKQKNPSLLAYGWSGALLLWFSQPLVFVLAGSWLTLFYHFRFAAPQRLLLPAGLWALSFGIYFFGFLTDSIGSDQLQNYHQQYFMPFAFWQMESLQWYGNTLVKIFRNPGGIFFTHLALLSAVVGLLFGFRQRVEQLILFLLPLLIALLVSGFHYYSTIPRLLLFAAPLLLLLVVKGLESIFFYLQKKQTSGRLPYLSILLGLVLLTQPFLNTAIHNMTGIEIEEVKTPLQFLVEHQKEGDQLYLYEFAKPAFRYYQTKYPLLDLNLLAGTPFYKKWQNDFEQLKTGDRVWLLFSHYKEGNGRMADQVYRAFLDQHGKLLLENKAEGVACYLYEWEN